MDHLNFVFSLLLIVSVTTSTFGSVIKAKNPNEESLVESPSDPDLFPNMAPKDFEALLKRSRHQSNPDMKTDAQAKLEEQNGLKDQESEMFKRVDPVTLIPTTVAELLEERVKTDPAGEAGFQIAISVENLSGYEWQQQPMYTDKGTEPALRQTVPDGESVLASSCGDKQGVDGVAGVLVYHIAQVEAPLAIMYRADNHFISWNVELDKDQMPASKDLYLAMLDNSYEAKDEWHEDTLSESLAYRVRMSKSPRATLQIQISKIDGSGK